MVGVECGMSKAARRKGQKVGAEHLKCSKGDARRVEQNAGASTKSSALICSRDARDSQFVKNGGRNMA